MTKLSSPMLQQSQRKPLAACVAAIFALSAPSAIANTVVVTNCSDSDPGSLRDAIGAATTMDGDTISMTGLPAMGCSVISLFTGAVTISKNNLTLTGPSSGVTISSMDYNNGFIQIDRVLNHTGTGTLTLNHVAVTFGSPYSTTSNVLGGCIYSAGSVYLRNTRVSSCSADASSMHFASGGGIFTKGDLKLKYSTIDGNAAGNLSAFGADGGGAYVVGNFTATYSTISGNRVGGSFGGFGGGVEAKKNVTIAASTISGNSAHTEFGAIWIKGDPSANSALISNSTISGNLATIVGGIYSKIPTTVRNSTIAFNDPSGLVIGAGSVTIAVNLQSSLLSNNIAFSSEDDFAVGGTGTVTVTGANNLIRVTSSSVPPDTITGACPLLGPLRNNGGLTLTHALLSHSPAIDKGNNAATLGEDQRGILSDGFPRPYPRVSGSFADIGAYDVQQGDIIFNHGFEGCP